MSMLLQRKLKEHILERLTLQIKNASTYAVPNHHILADYIYKFTKYSMKKIRLISEPLAVHLLKINLNHDHYAYDYRTCPSTSYNGGPLDECGGMGKNEQKNCANS